MVWGPVMGLTDSLLMGRGSRRPLSPPWSPPPPELQPAQLRRESQNLEVGKDQLPRPPPCPNTVLIPGQRSESPYSVLWGAQPASAGWPLILGFLRLCWVLGTISPSVSVPRNTCHWMAKARMAAAELLTSGTPVPPHLTGSHRC